MKLSKYIHVIYDNKFTLLFNTINSCLVQLPPYSGDPDFILDSLKEEEIQYLKNNDFFIEDEKAMDIFYDVPKQSVLNIIISFTEYCNLHCKYCYENNIKQRETITIDIIDKILAYISNVLRDNQEISEIHFDLIGGEPLLALDKIQYLITKMKSFETLNIYYLLETNGTLFNNEARKVFEDVNLITHITLSLPEDHNQMRPYAQNAVSGTFSDIAINLIRSRVFFESNNHNLVVRYNLHNGNKDSFEDYLLFIKQLLPYDFTIEIAPIIDYEYNGKCGELSQKEYSKWYLPKYFHDRDKLYTSKDFLLPSTRYKQCVGYQPNNIKVNPDGTLSLCNAWVEGNRKGTIDMLLAGISKEKIFPHCNIASRLDDECNNCGFLFLCGGKRICRGDNQCHFVDFDINDYLVLYATERG